MKFKALQLAAVSAAAIATVSTAQAGLYGRVTYNAVTGDTGTGDIEFQRHGFAETTFGGKGSVKAGGLTYGAQVELGIAEGVRADTPTDAVSIGRVRNQKLSIAGDFGKVTLGSGTLPSFVVDSVDSSGTWVADPSGWLSRVGAGGGVGHTTPAMTLLFDEQLRYDSPALGGIAKVAVAILENSGSDLTLRLNTNGFKFHAWTSSSGPDGSEIDRSGILAGYKHSSGFSISATSSTYDPEGGTEVDLTSVKFGYQTGKHAVSYQVNEIDDGTSLNTLTYVLKASKGVFLWARNASADDGATVTSDGSTVTDGSVTAFGGMVKF